MKLNMRSVFLNHPLHVISSGFYNILIKIIFPQENILDPSKLGEEVPPIEMDPPKSES